MFVPAIGFIVLGIALSSSYALMFAWRVKVKLSDEESQGFFGGWVGGSFFIAVGLLFILPASFLWLVIPIGIIWLSSWWPITLMIRRHYEQRVDASKASQHIDNQA